MRLQRLTALCVVACSGVVLAQPVLTKVVRQSDTVQVNGVQYWIHSIDSVSAAGLGRYAVSARAARSGGTPTAMLFGSRTGDPGLLPSFTVLQAPDQSAVGTTTPLRAFIEPQIGINSNGRLVYSSGISNRLGGVLQNAPGFLDSLWVDDGAAAFPTGQCTVLTGLSASSEFAGAQWTFASKPSVLMDGTPYWLGGLSYSIGGKTDSSGVFRGVGAGIQRQLGSGDPVASYGLVQSPVGISNFAVSSAAGRLIAVVNLDAPLNMNQAVVTVEPSPVSPAVPLLMKGDLVGNLVPGRHWKTFTLVGIADVQDCHVAPSWFVAGECSAPAGSSWLLVRDGMTLYREGSQIVGLTLVGAPLDAAMNSSGDLLFLWPASLPGYAPTPILFLNGQPILRPGDLIDTDGNGVGDETFEHIWPVMAISNADENGLLDVYSLVSLYRDVNSIRSLIRIRTNGVQQTACIADFNHSGGSPDDTDVFDFFQAWNNGDPSADVNCSGGTPDDGDVFYFMDRWFAGC